MTERDIGVLCEAALLVGEARTHGGEFPGNCGMPFPGYGLFPARLSLYTEVMGPDTT